ncbi:MAG: PIN domain-containing protein [Acidobacteriota bacterium]
MRILDTDVCIEILRGNRQVIRRRRETLDTVTTTWVTAAELFFGAARSKAPGDNRHLASRFLTTLDVLGLDTPAVERFGGLKAGLEAEGRRLADFDLLIAAIALSYGAVLVTGNRRHYDRVPGLELEDWIRG